MYDVPFNVMNTPLYVKSFTMKCPKHDRRYITTPNSFPGRWSTVISDGISEWSS